MHVLAAIRSPGAVALLSGLIGLGGAVLGAAVGGFATYKIEAARQRSERGRDRARELAVVRGVARVWRSNLSDFAAIVGTALTAFENPEWWDDRLDAFADVEMPLADKKAVAAELTNDQWHAIDMALFGVATIRSLRAVHFTGNQESDLIIEPGAVEHLTRGLETIKTGMKTLQELAQRLPDVARS